MSRGGRRHISDALRRVLSSYIQFHDDVTCTDKVDFFYLKLSTLSLSTSYFSHIKS